MANDTAMKKKSRPFTYLFIFVFLIAVCASVVLYAAYTSVAFVNEASANGSNQNLSVNVWVPEVPGAPVIDAKNITREYAFRGNGKMKDLLTKETFKVYLHNHQTGKIIATDKFGYSKAESGFHHEIILTKNECLKSCSWHWEAPFGVKQYCQFIHENAACKK